MSSRLVLPFWISLLMPLIAAIGIAAAGPWVLVGPAFVFGVIPVLDALGGHDRRNPEPEAARRSWRFADLALWLWVPAQVGMIVAGIVRVGDGTLTVAEQLGLALSVGLFAGAGGINVAHELMHRPSRLARAAAEVLMTAVGYAHFCIEHVHGHHRHVATARDPASAERGETLYRFWGRTLVGSLRSAWAIETRRRGGGAPRGWADARVRMPVLLLGAWALATGLGGLSGLVFFVVQGLVAALLLETINYIEHYGLRRQQGPDGRYERVQPRHSWNASQRVTNWFLFNLQRHSDHHYLASRPYWALRHYDEVPQLPFGYATAVLVALVPPLWHRVMDPRVARWR